MEAGCTRSTNGYGNLVEECLGRELNLSLNDCDRHMQPWSSSKATIQENGDKRWNKIRFGWKKNWILLFMTHFISFHISIHINSQSQICEKMWIVMKNRHIRFLWPHFTNAFHTPFHNVPCTQKMETSFHNFFLKNSFHIFSHHSISCHTSIHNYIHIISQFGVSESLLRGKR